MASARLAGVSAISLYKGVMFGGASRASAISFFGRIFLLYGLWAASCESYAWCFTFPCGILFFLFVTCFIFMGEGFMGEGYNLFNHCLYLIPISPGVAHVGIALSIVPFSFLNVILHSQCSLLHHFTLMGGDRCITGRSLCRRTGFASAYLC